MTNNTPAKPSNSHTLTVERRPGETDQAATARSLLDPVTVAGVTLAGINNGQAGADINAFIAELQNHARDTSAGKLTRPEATMTAHIHTLDALFNTLTLKSLINANAGYADAAETYMRLAFKAQSQCRSTVETLAEMKNPASVAFVRQANIAHGPQQVNNGIEPSHAREIENRQTKLLEAEHAERLDIGATSTPSAAHQELETVEAINGTTNARG
jgi:hypothetical protein